MNLKDKTSKENTAKFHLLIESLLTKSCFNYDGFSY